MARTRSCFGVLKSGNPANQVAHARDWDWTEEAEEIEVDEMGSCESQSDAGPVKTTGSFKMFQDLSDPGQQEFVAGQVVPTELYPGGDASGMPFWSGDLFIRSISRRGGVTTAKIVEFDVSFSVNGSFTQATVP